MNPAHYRTLMDLKRRGWPQDGFTVLCMNCNCARAWFGVCPHERHPREILRVGG